MDGAFPGAASQREIYLGVGSSAVNTLFEGHNVSLISLGARGTGKTYTLVGDGSEPGLIECIVAAVLERTGGRDSYQLGVSCWDSDAIGGDGVVDLLALEFDSSRLPQRISPTVSIKVVLVDRCCG